MNRLKGKVAESNRSLSGLGRASAISLAAEGATIVAADVNVPGGSETVEMITKSGGEAFFFKADVSNSVDVEALVHETVGRYGRLDCAFNNAGIEGPHS